MSADPALLPGMGLPSPEAQAAAAAAMEQFKALQTIIVHLTQSKYIYAASAAIMYWDIFLTFDQEVQRVWKTRASLGKWLFLINRYVPPVTFFFDGFYQLHPNPSIEFCRHSLISSTTVGILSYGAIAGVLVLRTHALYQKTWLLIIMAVLSLVTVSTMLGIFGYVHRNFIKFVPPGSLPGVPGCASECGDPRCRFFLTIFWIPFFVLESFTVGLTAYKSWTSYVAVADKSPFITIIYRDGLMYYFVIMAMSVVNLVIWTAAPPSLGQVATNLLRSLQTTIASRILLNIRGMLDRNYGTATYFETTRGQVSTIEYRLESRGRMGATSVDHPMSAMKSRSNRYSEDW